MIRVNLVKDRTTVSKSGSSGGGKSIFSGFALPGFGRSKAKSSLSEGASLLVKFVGICAPIIGLMLFEQTNIASKQSQLESVQAQLGTAKQELDKLKLEVEAIERFKEDKKKFVQKLDTIKLLTKERLKVVKALEAIQSSMPEKAWITRMKITADKLDIEGQAVEELDVSALMQGMEENVFFKNVLLQSTTQVKNNEGVVKAYKITAGLERN